MSEATLFEHVDGRYAVAWGTATPVFAHNDPAWHRVGPIDVAALALTAPTSVSPLAGALQALADAMPSQPEYGLLPLPEKIPASIYRHAQLGDLYDRLAVHTYAVGYAQRCIANLVAPATAPEAPSLVDLLRADGWAVAVHNDYKLQGVPHTFWLFTKGDRAVKGEGQSDAEALEKVRAAIAATPVPGAALHLTTEELSSLQSILSALPTNEERSLLHARIAEHRGALQAAPSHQAAPVYGVTAQTRAVRDVLAERQRQVADKGLTPEHDDELTDGAMAVAAACYALADRFEEISEMGLEVLPQIWPWTLDDWKPGSRWRELVKAGALILAELDRIDRAAGPTGATL